MAKIRSSNITIAQGAESKWPDEIQNWLESYNEGEEPPPQVEQRLRVRLARGVTFGRL